MYDHTKPFGYIEKTRDGLSFRFENGATGTILWKVPNNQPHVDGGAWGYLLQLLDMHRILAYDLHDQTRYHTYRSYNPVRSYTRPTLQSGFKLT